MMTLLQSTTTLVAERPKASNAFLQDAYTSTSTNSEQSVTDAVLQHQAQQLQLLSTASRSAPLLKQNSQRSKLDEHALWPITAVPLLAW